MSASGTTDLNFGLGGMGNVDVSLAGKSNPAIFPGSQVRLDGNYIGAGGAFYVTFWPYYELDYEFATINGTTDGNPNTAEIDFNGLMTARVISDMGEFVAYYPAADTVGSDNGARNKNQISIGSNDVLYSTNSGGFAAIGAYLTLGLDVTFQGCTSFLCTHDTNLPGVSIIFSHLSTTLLRHCSEF